MGHLRVNNFLLETPIRQVNIPVTTTTTAEQIVQQALINFDLEVHLPFSLLSFFPPLFLSSLFLLSSLPSSPTPLFYSTLPPSILVIFFLS